MEEVCWLRESKASLLEGGSVVKVCRLRESRASLMNESCCQGVSAARVKSQPEEGEVVIKVCRLRESRASLVKKVYSPEGLSAVSTQDQPP